MPIPNAWWWNRCVNVHPWQYSTESLLEECKAEPSVEINRGLEDSLLKPALKKETMRTHE